MVSRAAMLLHLVVASALLSAGAPRDDARIVIDATEVEGPIDARLYGQFVEFMFEGVKGGLSAELLRNRGFEEAANSIARRHIHLPTTASERCLCRRICPDPPILVKEDSFI